MWLILLQVPSTGPEWTWLTQGGAIGILATVVVLFVTGKIVTGSSLETMRQERDKAVEQLRLERDRALDQVYKQTEITQRSLEVLERKVSR